MKRQKLIAIIMICAIFANLSLVCIVPANAHTSILDVSYDPCLWSSNISQLEIDKRWYVIVDSISGCSHISHTTPTIKYYFADESPSGYKWDDDISTELAEEIKACYANSMEKWNNVYFYSYDSDGYVIKNKVINVVEGTEEDHNLVIYPIINPKDGIYFARTEYIEDSKTQVQSDVNGVDHYHISEWYMWVNLDYFNLYGTVKQEIVNVARERTGAHEIGHILGLKDIDNVPICGSSEQDAHHEELLMGYGNPEDRQTEITYKDIAGVAITRGFHTDADHKWLLSEQQSDGTYKLICSICNGVKYVESLSGYVYNTYNACGENHELTSGNMMAVGSYGTSDYYKCKYCRYVAPFSSIVPQNYVAVLNEKGHCYTNNVEGLEYSFCYEPHSFTFEYLSYSEHVNICECGYTSIVNHSYSYGNSSASSHELICACGHIELESHTYIWINVRISKCLGCGRIKQHNGENEKVHLCKEDDEESETE